jgi:hypothetical protein
VSTVPPSAPHCRLPFSRIVEPVAFRCLRVLAQALARSMLPLPFPKEAVRDLLGITRALFRAERSKPTPDPSRLARLEEIGKQYRLAIDMGGKCGPDTIGNRAARSWAEKATLALGEYVAMSDLMAPAVAATAKKLSRRG